VREDQLCVIPENDAEMALGRAMDGRPLTAR
jgi:hypothetical protein